MAGSAGRLAAFYIAFFWIMGIYIAYWPVWLESRGLGAGEIGILLGAVLWARIPAGILAGALVDKRGDRRRPIVAMVVAVSAGYLLFFLAGGFWFLLLLSIFVGGVFTSVLPIADNLALLTAAAEKLDYARIRLWGSLSFIAATFAGGLLLARGDTERVLWSIFAGTLALVVCSCFLPDRRIAPSPVRGGTVVNLLRRPAFLTFLVTAGLLQSSHAVLYGFATLHWRRAGIGDEVIGWLWAEGVIAEVVLFALAANLPRFLTPPRLLLLAALGGAIRWPILATTTDLAWLIPAQLLHGLTFGAAHLGAMFYIAAAVRPAVSATAQSLYGAVSQGLVFGLVMVPAGMLFEAAGGRAFLAMAAVSVLGGAGAVVLARLWERQGPLA